MSYENKQKSMDDQWIIYNHIYIIINIQYIHGIMGSEVMGVLPIVIRLDRMSFIYLFIYSIYIYTVGVPCMYDKILDTYIYIHDIIFTIFLGPAWSWPAWSWWYLAENSADLGENCDQLRWMVGEWIAGIALSFHKLFCIICRGIVDTLLFYKMGFDIYPPVN